MSCFHEFQIYDFFSKGQGTPRDPKDPQIIQILKSFHFFSLDDQQHEFRFLEDPLVRQADGELKNWNQNRIDRNN